MNKDNIEALLLALATTRQAKAEFRKNDGFDSLNR
jgi:hypothetical protein